MKTGNEETYFPVPVAWLEHQSSAVHNASQAIGLMASECERSTTQRLALEMVRSMLIEIQRGFAELPKPPENYKWTSEWSAKDGA